MPLAEDIELEPADEEGFPTSEGLGNGEDENIGTGSAEVEGATGTLMEEHPGAQSNTAAQEEAMRSNGDPVPEGKGEASRAGEANGYGVVANEEVRVQDRGGWSYMEDQELGDGDADNEDQKQAAVEEKVHEPQAVASMITADDASPEEEAEAMRANAAGNEEGKPSFAIEDQKGEPSFVADEGDEEAQAPGASEILPPPTSIDEIRGENPSCEPDASLEAEALSSIPTEEEEADEGEKSETIKEAVQPPILWTERNQTRPDSTTEEAPCSPHTDDTDSKPAMKEDGRPWPQVASSEEEMDDEAIERPLSSEHGDKLGSLDVDEDMPCIHGNTLTDYQNEISNSIDSEADVVSSCTVAPAAASPEEELDTTTEEQNNGVEAKSNGEAAALDSSSESAADEQQELGYGKVISSTEDVDDAECPSTIELVDSPFESALNGPISEQPDLSAEVFPSIADMDEDSELECPSAIELIEQDSVTHEKSSSGLDNAGEDRSDYAALPVMIEGSVVESMGEENAGEEGSDQATSPPSMIEANVVQSMGDKENAGQEETPNHAASPPIIEASVAESMGEENAGEERSDHATSPPSMIEANVVESLGDKEHAGQEETPDHTASPLIIEASVAESMGEEIAGEARSDHATSPPSMIEANVVQSLGDKENAGQEETPDHAASPPIIEASVAESMGEEKAQSQYAKTLYEEVKALNKELIGYSPPASEIYSDSPFEHKEAASEEGGIWIDSREENEGSDAGSQVHANEGKHREDTREFSLLSEKEVDEGTPGKAEVSKPMVVARTSRWWDCCGMLSAFLHRDSYVC